MQVWEVVANLTGYACTVAVLSQLDASHGGTWTDVVSAWAITQAVHVGLRYKALKQLAFPTMSHKRAAALVSAHVAIVLQGKHAEMCGASSSSGSSSLDHALQCMEQQERQVGHSGQGSCTLPSVSAVNAAEPMLALESAVRPRMQLGCSVQQAFGGMELPSASVLQEWLARYRDELYVLMWREGTAYVVLKEGFTPRSVMRAYWQAAWLEAQSAAPAVQYASSSSSSESSTGAGSWGLYERSLAAMHAHFDAFESLALQAGWKLDVLQMKYNSKARLRLA